MAKVIENKFIFRNQNLAYCYNCRTEMGFTGYSYVCPLCGSVYEQNLSEV